MARIRINTRNHTKEKPYLINSYFFFSKLQTAGWVESITHNAKGASHSGLGLLPIEGFHVTLYQADFANHRTFNHHVGFLFAWCGIAKHKKMYTSSTEVLISVIKEFKNEKRFSQYHAMQNLARISAYSVVQTLYKKFYHEPVCEVHLLRTSPLKYRLFREGKPHRTVAKNKGQNIKTLHYNTI